MFDYWIGEHQQGSAISDLVMILKPKKILIFNIILTYINMPLKKNLISMNAVCLKIMIEKVFKLI